MSKLSVVAKIVAKKGSLEIVKSELVKMIAPTRKETGCIGYALHQDNDSPEIFFFYETWESLAHLQAHMNTDHFKNYVNAVDGLIDEKIVHKLTLIE